MKEKKGNQYRAPETQADALILALKLAITANDQERADMAVGIAVDLSHGLSEQEIALCKKQAIKEVLEESRVH